MCTLSSITQGLCAKGAASWPQIRTSQLLKQRLHILLQPGPCEGQRVVAGVSGGGHNQRPHILQAGRA